MATKKLRPSQMIEDLTIYPRHTIEAVTVNRYADAYRIGDLLPNPIVDGATLRIVDGFHRIRAWTKANGDEKMTVTVRRYDDEKALVIDAVNLNAAHGKPFASQDLIRVHRILVEHGYSIEDTAKVLHVTQPRLERLIETRTATVATMEITTTKPKAAAPVEHIALKPALRHMAGTELTVEQSAVNDYLAGSNQTYLVRQLRLILDSGLLDRDDDTLRYELAGLRDALIESTLPELVGKEV